MCRVALGQYYASDGCYPAMPNISSTSTSTTSTTSTFTSSPFATDATSPTPTPTSTIDSNLVPSSSSGNGLSTGDVASLVVGVVGVIFAALAVLYAEKQYQAGKLQPAIQSLKQFFGGSNAKRSSSGDTYTSFKLDDLSTQPVTLLTLLSTYERGQ